MVTDTEMEIHNNDNTYNTEFYEPIMIKVVWPDALVPSYYLVMMNSNAKYQMIALSEGIIFPEHNNIQECFSNIGTDYEVVEDGWKACVLAAQRRDKEIQNLAAIEKWNKEVSKWI